MTIPRVVRAANPSPMTLDGTRTFIVGRTRVVIIDPGPADPSHVHAVAEVVADAQSVEIVVTHHHRDHAGAAQALARQVGGRIVTGRPHGGATTTVEYAEDGDVLETDQGSLTVLATPGHTPDHIALLWTPAAGGRAAFVGDLLLGEGDTTLVAAPEGDVAAYLNSLDRLEALGVERLYPAHGEPLTEPTSAIRRFRVHRLQRVDQVRRVLSEDPLASTPEIVDRLYGDALPAGLRGAAAGSVEAVRAYLRSIDAGCA